MSQEDYVTKNNLCPVCMHAKHDGRLEGLTVYGYVCDGKRIVISPTLWMGIQVQEIDRKEKKE